MTEKQFLVQLGERIATARRQQKLTQEQLAEMVDLHRTYIGFIEQGTRSPSMVSIYKIALALKINIKDLVAD